MQPNDGYGDFKSGESELNEPLIRSPVIEYLDEQWEPMRVRLRQLKKEELGRIGKESGLALDTNRGGAVVVEQEEMVPGMGEVFRT